MLCCESLEVNQIARFPEALSATWLLTKGWRKHVWLILLLTKKKKSKDLCVCNSKKEFCKHIVTHTHIHIHSNIMRPLKIKNLIRANKINNLESKANNNDYNLSSSLMLNFLAVKDKEKPYECTFHYLIKGAPQVFGGWHISTPWNWNLKWVLSEHSNIFFVQEWFCRNCRGIQNTVIFYTCSQ